MKYRSLILVNQVTDSTSQDFRGLEHRLLSKRQHIRRGRFGERSQRVGHG